MLGFARQRGFDPIRTRLWHYRAVIDDTPRLLEKGESDDAIRRLERVVRDFPDHPEVLLGRIRLAISYRRRGEHVVAEKQLTELLAQEGWCARAHLALAEVYGDLSRWDEATASYRAAMDRAQEREDGIYTGRGVFAEAVLSAAYSDLRRGELDSCAARTKQIEALRPESPDVYFLTGSIALRRGGDENLREGVRNLRRALRLASGQTEILGPLISALTQLGETEEAEGYRKQLEAIQERKRLEAERKYQPVGPGAVPDKSVPDKPAPDTQVPDKR
jgi:tetratricopeptide (TPR) repeat protein